MELPLLRPRSKISLETIEFQDDDFTAKLELIVSELQAKILNEAYQKYSHIEESREAQQITDIILHRLGLKIKLVVNGPLAAIMPFYTNKNHVLMDEFFRGWISIKEQDIVLRNAHNKRGTVNLQKAKVGGFFSECECELYMDFISLFKTYKLSAAETTAVLLHELGHAFYAFEYSDRLETANQVFQNVIKEVTSKKDKADKVYVYRELKSVNSKITEEEIDLMLKGNKVIAGNTWFKAIIGTVQEQLQNSKYSDTSFEQLADNFASRFGYGRQIVGALEKLTGQYFLDPEKSKVGFLLIALSETIIFALLIASAVVSIPVTAMGAIFYGMLAFLFLKAKGESSRDYTYDDLKIRYKRVRNEYVQQLKDQKFPLASVKPILDNIYSLDAIISQLFVYRGPLATISNFVFSSDREAMKTIKEQQLLEELAMNDLFIASAELRTLNT